MINKSKDLTRILLDEANKDLEILRAFANKQKPGLLYPRTEIDNSEDDIKSREIEGPFYEHVLCSYESFEYFATILNMTGYDIKKLIEEYNSLKDQCETNRKEGYN